MRGRPPVGGPAWLFVQSLLKLEKWHTDPDQLWPAVDVSLNRFNNGMANSNVNTRMH
jgi:hypothetical protein